jgi:L-fuconolactonase
MSVDKEIARTMPTPREEWLSLTIEDPLDPHVPICDAHHHLLSTGPYLIEEFLSDIAGGHNVVSTVYVEADASHYRAEGPEELRPVGETEFVVAQTRLARNTTTDVAAAIVGFADLTRGARVGPALDAHIAASGQRFRGVRQSMTWHDSPEIISWAKSPAPLADEAFLAGFELLERYDLSFDAWIFHTQIEELSELANAFPSTTIVLNHVGGPLGVGPYYGRHGEVLEEWKLGIEAIAATPNVVVKLGGLGMPMCGFRWRKASVPPSSTELAEGMAPYYLWCVEQLGADRCMFESNFPVDKVSYSYTVLWNAFKRLIASLPEQDRSALLHDTAVATYRIGRE